MEGWLTAHDCFVLGGGGIAMVERVVAERQ